MYRMGKGVDKNYKEARKYYEIGAKNAKNDWSGMQLLGIAMIKGAGGDKNINLGCKLIENAALKKRFTRYPMSNYWS